MTRIWSAARPWLPAGRELLPSSELRKLGSIIVQAGRAAEAATVSTLSSTSCVRSYNVNRFLLRCSFVLLQRVIALWHTPQASRYSSPRASEADRHQELIARPTPVDLALALSRPSLAASRSGPPKISLSHPRFVSISLWHQQRGTC